MICTGDELKTKGDSTVIRVGGHFPGSCALHWPHGSAGKGSLFSGDTIQVVPDNRSSRTVLVFCISLTADALVWTLCTGMMHGAHAVHIGKWCRYCVAGIWNLETGGGGALVGQGEAGFRGSMMFVALQLDIMCAQ